MEPTCNLSANQFNDYFSNVTSVLISNLPMVDIDPIKYCKSNLVSSAPVFQVEVREAILNLKNGN